MPSISTNDLRKNLADVLNRAAYKEERTVITRHGKPVAAVVSAADLAALEALEDRLDTQAAEAALAEAETEEAAGRKGYYTLAEVEAELRGR